MVRGLVTALLFIATQGAANAGFFGHSNFDECLMDGANNAKTALATAHVREVCSRKFPKTVPPEDTDLTGQLARSGAILTPAQYRYIYSAHYKDMTYEKFIQKLYEQNVRPFHPNMTLQEFKQKALP